MVNSKFHRSKKWHILFILLEKTPRIKAIILFIKESTYNGKLEYSHYETSRDSYFLVKEKPKSKKAEMTDWEYLIAALNWLLDKKELSEDEYYQFSQQLSEYYSEKPEEPETPDLNRFIIANPYYIDNKYLSLFRIDVSNSTDSYQSLKGEIHVEFGDQLLEALGKDEIIEMLKINDLYNDLKYRNLERHHLSKELMIPPH